ncbi:hypothetical protein NL676_014928 [Syzygium grande]|nr:hypothetical protein NL676_014928 [Syzygium grande]
MPLPAKKLKEDSVKDNRPPILSMDDYEKVTNEYNCVKNTWSSNKIVPASTTLSFYPMTQNPRYYTLKFHWRHRKLITQSYINHVLTEGKAITSRNQQLKLYTNDPQDSMRIHAVLKHPATFESLAMHPDKKTEIMNDLTKFTDRKEYYAKIGKAWWRGYLLMVPLDQTSIAHSIFTGQRKQAEEENNEEDVDPIKKTTRTEKKSSKVTLSGLLNFIDGIWSACDGERVIVFTTNHVDKLNPALIRRGRMDKHIEMLYCCLEAVKSNNKDACVRNLIQVLEAAKKKTEEAARLKAKREKLEKRLKWWRETKKRGTSAKEGKLSGFIGGGMDTEAVKDNGMAIQLRWDQIGIS